MQNACELGLESLNVPYFWSRGDEKCARGRFCAQRDGSPRGRGGEGSKKENIIPRPKEEQRSLRHLDLMNTTKESGGTECMSKKKGRSPLFKMSPFLTLPRPERS